MKRMTHAVVLAVTFALLNACATRESRPQTASLYPMLSDGDLKLAEQTVQRALEEGLSHETFVWRNANSGHSGTVTPIRTYKTNKDFYCRVYTGSVIIGARAERYDNNVACRDRDGIWKPVK